MIRGRIHTDLALEAKERYEEDNVEIRGVCIEEEYNEEKDIRTTLVKIETENGARAMGRPQGSYLTLESPNLSIPDEGYHREISEELARQVKKLIPEKKELTVLVVGLGNRQVTPDALGPDVVDNLKMTRHIILEYGAQAMGEQNMYQVSGLVPGVMAQTGMETLEIVKGVINETRPDVVIAVDALAARSTKQVKSYNPDYRYRNHSGLWCRKSQKWADKGDTWSKGNRNRSADGGGCSNNCTGFNGKTASDIRRKRKERISGGNDSTGVIQHVCDAKGRG